MYNPNFKKLEREYIFPVIEEKLRQLRIMQPDLDIVNLGIGDVAFPLSPVFLEAFERALSDMKGRVIGYGPSGGYDFLKKRIIEVEDYPLEPDEIFINDGINHDISHFLELFSSPLRIGMFDPTYPVYGDAATLYGHEVIPLPCTPETGFGTSPPSMRLDAVFLCNPNNPTGTALSATSMARWIAWANEYHSLLLFDCAYCDFIRSPEAARSIYRFEGSKNVAVSFHSFSKSFGFTGLRLGYTIIPHEICAEKGSPSLHKLWNTIVNTKSNGTSYLTQKAGYYCLEEAARAEKSRLIAKYLASASRLKQILQPAGAAVYGGTDCPYVWWHAGNEMFDRLLNKHGIVTVPGSGFGKGGTGFIRLSGFISDIVLEKACTKLVQCVPYEIPNHRS